MSHPAASPGVADAAAPVTIEPRGVHRVDVPALAAWLREALPEAAEGCSRGRTRSIASIA